MLIREWTPKPPINSSDFFMRLQIPIDLVEWIHFTLFGIILPTKKTESVFFWAYELSN